MKNSRFASFIFLTTLAASMFIMSCKSNSTAPAPSPSIQDTGSTFTWQESNSGILDTIVYTVFDTTATNPLTHGGKVIGLRGLRMSNNTSSTMLWSYETDGDVSIYPNPSGDPTTWMTLPFVSHNFGVSTFSVGQPNPSFDTASAVWSGSGSFLLNGQSHSTDSVTLTVTQTFTTPPATSSQVFHYTYLPDIGIIGIVNADNGAVDNLIAYSIK